MHECTFIAESDLFGGVRAFFERVLERPWAAVVELTLIGIVVYSALRALQGTRGARLVRAVLIILAVGFAIISLLAERFEFDRLNALYPYFILGVFLVSLVAFQAELRRLLLKIGEGAWFLRWIRGGDHLVDPVVTAVDRLARRKIGAVIAIERSAESGAVLESGVPLDAVISAELLETIFWPGSALHDLGVLIGQGRIRAAGCQFPLVESGELDRSLGSRHRAAVGMSQETDAVVVVVSEETGVISIASRGTLRRGLSPEALREELRVELGIAGDGDAAGRRGIPRVVGWPRIGRSG